MKEKVLIMIHNAVRWLVPLTTATIGFFVLRPLSFHNIFSYKNIFSAPTLYNMLVFIYTSNKIWLLGKNNFDRFALWVFPFLSKGRNLFLYNKDRQNECSETEPIVA
jgi:hypothetical protein